MKIKLTNEQMKDISDENDLIVDNEIWKYEEQDGEREEDEQGRYYSYIYRRPSDGKYFRINIFYCRYGYKDYGFEADMQDNTAYEVERKEITTVQWVSVK